MTASANPSAAKKKPKCRRSAFGAPPLIFLSEKHSGTAVEQDAFIATPRPICLLQYELGILFRQNIHFVYDKICPAYGKALCVYRHRGIIAVFTRHKITFPFLQGDFGIIAYLRRDALGYARKVPVHHIEYRRTVQTVIFVIRIKAFCPVLRVNKFIEYGSAPDPVSQGVLIGRHQILRTFRIEMERFCSVRIHRIMHIFLY